MKNALLLSFSLLILSCSTKTADTGQQTEAVVSETTQQAGAFDWILGDWVRTNSEEGQQTFEQWRKVSSDEYMGFGFTLQSGDTLSQEIMQFKKDGERWTLLVSMPGEPDPTPFAQQSVDAEAFVFNNPENEFPHTIQYWKENQFMKAKIWNDEFEIDFIFEPEGQ